ncbi:MAG: archaetidylserine decarboxylase [Gammaproteobacteria bacterium]|nr:archaetidylserine decarboxylase [Gammaproteobacteria bacterium]
MRPVFNGLMKIRRSLGQLGAQEDLNFLLTNRIPRLWVTRCMGRISKIENPLLVRFALAIWRTFSDLNLEEAAPGDYRSIHDIFTRKLREGARTVNMDPSVVASPCDAIVGALGTIDKGQLLQAKGMPYALSDLLLDPALCEQLQGGTYLTLRLTSVMYHRFHAPHDLTVEEVIYHSGDTWNVNPIAVKRIERLFCLNERAVLRCRLAATGQTFALVPVAAVMVASIKLHFLNVLLNMGYRGPHRLSCSAQARKGEEMGWFEHGSTIIVLTPPGFGFAEGIQSGATIRMGQALMTLPSA